MPEIKPIKILSFSSEDDLYPVKNLLKESSSYQWKCKSPSESEIYVEFQFASQTKFTRIEMGNSGSAFVEVRVSRFMERANYQVLLGSTSLMTPSEALKCESLNRVKYFKDANFSKEICSQKWDVIKLVCTQPFNKTLNFGLSFIKFFGETDSDSSVQEKQSLPINPKIDVSKYLDVTSNDNDWLPGSLFNKRKLGESFNLNKIRTEKLSENTSTIKNDSEIADKKLEEKPIIKQSISASSINNTTTKNSEIANKKVEEKPIMKQSISTSSINNTTTKSKSIKLPNDVTSQFPNPNRKRQNPDLNKNITSKPKKYKLDSSQNSDINNTSSTINNELIPSTSFDNGTTNSISRKSVSNIDDDFENIFKDVVFVLSGYQNPLRNNIRDKALSMGGKYRSSWTNDSTHLICAFNNTPKFKEVLGKGIIVSENWILECYNKKKFLPWREFRLKGASSPPMKINKISITKPSISVNNIASNSDENPVAMLNKTASIPDDTNDIKLSINSLPKLPQIFENMHFFFYGNFENVDLQFYKRIIIAFGGVVHDYMDLSVKLVITNSFWDHNFDEALNINPDLKFVKSSWIDTCDEQNAVVSTDDFEIQK